MSEEIDEIILRCRNCRRILLTRKTKEKEEKDCCKTFYQLESILDDDNRDDSETPDWIISSLNENQWRKGKLCCPCCNGKVGSFNFINIQKCACGRCQSPPVFLYKSRIDICSTKKNDDVQTRHRDHFAVLKRSIDEEWMVVFDSKPSDFNSNTPPLINQSSTNVKSHRKSHSWHANSVSNWFASTLADVSTAATETKQALVETLDLAGSVVKAPVSSAIKKGHRKTKSWSGSIKTTLSTLLGGLFSKESTMTSTPEVSLRDEESANSISDNGATLARVLDDGQHSVESPEKNDSTLPSIDTVPKSGANSKKPKNRKAVHNLATKSTGKKSNSGVSLIPDYLLCAICLDIFCLPRYCLPCRHLFCEPCLKLLAHSLPLPRNRLRTLCPLCRQIIRWTEPAADVIGTLMGANLASKYVKRVLEYERQPSIRNLILPGLYQLKFVRQLIGRLPEGVTRYLETFWVDYTPLVTLYSFCVSLLCLLFFFTLFLPCVYLTSWIFKLLENFSSFNEIGVGVIYQEVLDLGALVISSGMFSLASIVVIISIALYTLFVM